MKTNFSCQQRMKFFIQSKVVVNQGQFLFIKFDNLSNSQSQSNPRQYHHTRFFSSPFFQFHTYTMHHRHKHKALHGEIKDHMSNRLCLWTRCATTSPTDRNPLSSSSHHHKHNQSYLLHCTICTLFSIMPDPPHQTYQTKSAKPNPS